MLLLKTIVLLGALQGIIVSGLLWVSGRRRPEERVSRQLLSILVLLIAMCCLNLYLIHVDWWTNTTVGQILGVILPLILAMPFGPLIYFYIRSCEEPEFRFTRKYRPHFYPVTLDLLQHIAALLFVIGLLTRLIPPNKYHFGIFEDYYDQYVDIPRWLSLTIYLLLATRYLRHRRESGKWPKKILRVFWAFDVLWLVHLIPYELPGIGDELINRFDWYPLYIPLVFIIYFLGANGYFISYRGKPAPAPDKRPVPIPLEKLEQLSLRVRNSMEQDQLWLQPDLTLGKLAEHCGVAPKTLSIVLNQFMGVSFTDYINQFRVDAVKTRIIRPESRQLTIAGLAYECGFNSLPTFQRAFKATTGMSPKEYMMRNALFEM